MLWHPMAVHFPLALTLMACALLLGARLLRRPELTQVLALVGTWNLCLGAALAVITLGTGLAAVLNLDVSAAARASVSTHAKWAIFTTLALVLLAVWRGAGTEPRSRPGWLFIIVLLAASSALIVTGYRGGQNVYRYGIGVETSSGGEKPAVRP
jgi:uncharacterized membrane protein